MTFFRVSGLGIIGPGISNRADLNEFLSRKHTGAMATTEIGTPEIINPRERRRTSPTVRLALGAASQAVRESECTPNDLPMVFASSLGDGSILNELLEVLADPARHVSPTRFHNSVHNSALAYWSIGTQNRLAGTSLAAHDCTFGAAILKSIAQLLTEQRALLLVVYDHPFPAPLDRARPLLAPFAAAFVLSPPELGNGIDVCLSLVSGSASLPTPPQLECLNELWKWNPAARALPFVEALVQGWRTHVDVMFQRERTLRLEVCP